MRILAVAAFALVSAGAAAAPKAKKAQIREVPVTVTKDGFEPAEIKVKRGEKVRLVVTRKVQRTCATEIVFKDLEVEKALPLEEPVTIDLAPAKAGALRFACAMDMIGGTVIVE
jgi:plastocyanin domain-containing protein